jgi:NAD(P)-dependent dehydrogenase (short-subunit alcohol dehydrogenase family)
MEVDLAGRFARVQAAPSALADAIAAALRANGASVADPDGACDILVLIATNAANAAATARPVGKAMQPGGRIVLLTSALGLVPARGEAEWGIEAAGIIHLARSLALEFAGSGVLVNAVAVGAMAGERLAERLRSHAQFGPATWGDVANAVLFLVDPASSYVTGHVLTVDGGWTAGYARDF